MTGKLSYGWVIIIVCTLATAISYGIMYSFSVFFKPLLDHFNWDRATVSSIFSVFLIIRGAVSIGIGWLADKYGAIKLSALCGFMTGLGLILASRVTELWQLYLAYGLIEAIGLSGSFTINFAVTSRWFIKNRGMALGIVSAGSGLGTLTLVPTAEHLISTFDWSTTFLILGIGAGAFITGTAFLMRPAPEEKVHQNETTKKPGISTSADEKVMTTDLQTDRTLGNAAFSKEMIMLVITFSLILFCIQMIMIHLVNYATDMGISPLQAASFVSIIGMVSIIGRLSMGRASDRIGVNNSLIICSILRVVSLIWLFFVTSPWGFYLFAVLFGFAYGGEMPQMPMFISHFFGTRAMAALMGLFVFVANIGGALGPWVAGAIHDATLSYHYAFVIAVAASLGALAMALVLKKHDQAVSGYY